MWLRIRIGMCKPAIWSISLWVIVKKKQGEKDMRSKGGTNTNICTHASHTYLLFSLFICLFFHAILNITQCSNPLQHTYWATTAHFHTVIPIVGRILCFVTCVLCHINIDSMYYSQVTYILNIYVCWVIWYAVHTMHHARLRTHQYDTNTFMRIRSN